MSVMRVPDVDAVLESLRDLGDARYGDGAEEREIAEVEQRLGLVIPAGYRGFVRQVGWASAGGLEILGLGARVPPELDLREVIADVGEDLPANAIPFAREEGELYCLDAAHEGPYESPAYRWDREAPADQALVYAGHDFASWLWMRLAERA
jgi:hypothetical protein